MSPPQSADKPPSAVVQNPNRWRCTWEAQSHAPTLRLLLFNPKTNPSIHCRDIKLNLFPEKSLLTVSFIDCRENPPQTKTSVLVPVPRVLIDSDSSINFRAFDDHIEVKLVLLLPVDHSLVSGFDTIIDSEGIEEDEFRPITLDSDVNKLSGMEVVNFYCRSCSAKLTEDLRCFQEMPSVNWRDCADNWFGNCCCSFGGISETMVADYVKSYACEPGMCLLSMTSVLISKNDLLGCEFPDAKIKQKLDTHHSLQSHSCLTRVSPDEVCKSSQHNCCGNRDEVVSDKMTLSSHAEHDVEVMKFEPSEHVTSHHNIPCSALHIDKNKESMDGVSDSINCDNGCCAPSALETASTDTTSQLFENQKVFQDGFLGSGFMVRSSGLSKDIRWNELLCRQCLCLIGAYPCFDDEVPLDGGVRLFKCHISTSLPSTPSKDAFRKYSLERMFTSQLLESAEEELSFRTVVRDMKTKAPILQIVILNPNSWCCTGYSTEPAKKLVMRPIIKVLYSVCGRDMEVDKSMAERVRQNEADEVYMFSSQIMELVTALDVNNSLTPPSSRSMQGLLLSSIRR